MIHIVIGTKAQLIKMAPIMKYLEDHDIFYNYIYTGQHKDTMDDIHENFGIKNPDIILYKKEDIVSVGGMFGWILRMIYLIIFKSKEIIRNDKKGIVLVHGDTISTFLGALLGKFARLKVGHVESGLRSFNIFHPFPEELTRLITFKLSDYYFCPGKWAVKNLIRYSGVKIDTSANTLYDSLSLALPSIEKYDVEIPAEKYCVVTIHRFENLSKYDRMKKLTDFLVELSDEIKVLFIMHNPTKRSLAKHKLIDNLRNSNIEIRNRYDYFRFIKLLKNSEFVISDGGSNQEECFYLGKPVLLYRMESERQEGLGQNAIISKYDMKIVKDFTDNYKNYRFDPSILDYNVSEQIVRSLRNFY
ncbi:MAG: UDP-N-acetylglucosamine 2-epimerase [Candidatus Delongbacteria bacterium]|nr:UDP-N-acetylglucosamine 2-epimerase [Candidatus Delongbacteria bacterium]MBN2834351.1 UDP-N-acetylglucosamine 2-epimerase [Candidatus Delongbacteria bacterium]